MPFCHLLDLQHQKSWEVYLPSTHRQETLQENAQLCSGENSCHEAM